MVKYMSQPSGHPEARQWRKNKMERRYLVNDVLDAMKKHELIKSPASEDVLVISLCNNLDQ